MKYTVEYTRIKSSWFDQCEKKNVYEKIGYEGLYLYFQLFKFRIHNQEHEHTFITSIGMLRKETGYTTEKVFSLLKVLKSAKVIHVQNVSRWSYLLDGNKVRDKDILVIVATDVPETVKKGDKVIPVSEEDKYIGISFDMFDVYNKLKFSDRYYALYCLINKWNNNAEKKSWMSVEKMSEILGIDKDYIHKMIVNMNKNYVMYSQKRERDNRKGYYFEHHIANSLKMVEYIRNEYGDKIEKWISGLKSR